MEQSTQYGTERISDTRNARRHDLDATNTLDHTISAEGRHTNTALSADDAPNALSNDLSEVNSFEDLLHKCCGHGRWQNILLAYMSSMWLILPFFSMSVMFFGGTPSFKCADGFPENATYASLPAGVPECVSYNNSSVACSHWVFSTEIFQSTVVTEWELVCDRKPLLSMLQALLMLGGLAGALMVGPLVDRFGRRPVFLPAAGLITACAFALAAVTQYAPFAVFRFLCGVAMAVMIGSQFIVVTELCRSKLRALITALTLFPFVIGTILVPAFSYWIRTRRLLLLAYAVPCLILIPNLWLMPESPRWLVVQGQHDKACDIMIRGAKCNGRIPPSRNALLKAMRRLQPPSALTSTEVSGLQQLLHELLQLIRTPRMRRNMLISALAFFVASGSYFGIAFDTTQLSSDPHLTGALIGLVDLPASFFFLLIDWFGRRLPIAGSYLLAAVAMFLRPFIHGQTAIITLGLLGKLGVGIAFSALYTFTPEYLPTSLRGLGFGVCQVAMRLGAVVSPFVVDLMTMIDPVAPSLVFGGFALVTALSILLLPETKGMRMPASVQELESGLEPENTIREPHGVDNPVPVMESDAISVRQVASAA